jgi:hypothetical protein
MGSGPCSKYRAGQIILASKGVNGFIPYCYSLMVYCNVSQSENYATFTERNRKIHYSLFSEVTASKFKIFLYDWKVVGLKHVD